MNAGGVKKENITKTDKVSGTCRFSHWDRQEESFGRL